MGAPPVIMYLTSWCPYCASARELLQSKQVSVQEIDVDAQPDRRLEMIRRSGRRTVPQIFIGERHVGGCVFCQLSCDGLAPFVATVNQIGAPARSRSLAWTAADRAPATPREANWRESILRASSIASFTCVNS